MAERQAELVVMALAEPTIQRLTIFNLDDRRIEVTHRGDSWSVTFDGEHYDFPDTDLVEDFVVGLLVRPLTETVGGYFDFLRLAVRRAARPGEG